MTLQKIVTCLHQGKIPSIAALTALIRDADAATRDFAAAAARDVTLANFGTAIFIRGLIELTSYCNNDCFYCGIRRSNTRAARYRLSLEQVLACCHQGYELGFRTFVLQGGEDKYFTDQCLGDMVAAIKENFGHCAVTLSLGERSRGSWQRLLAAGADRYLLRHETASPRHYAKLHPSSMVFADRQRCLYELKAVGFQTGAGFMVGSPFQTAADLAADLLFLHGLQPEMVGVGPFIPHRDTPFASYPAGCMEQTLFILSLVRLLLPFTLIPATTALGTLEHDGRERGILRGANVVMPNLSPLSVRGKYTLYDGKLVSGGEAAENLNTLRQRLESIGRSVVVARGDFSGRPLHITPK